MCQSSSLHIPPKVIDAQAFHFPHGKCTLTAIVSNYFLKFLSVPCILHPLKLPRDNCLMHHIPEDFHIRPIKIKQDLLCNYSPWPSVTFLVGLKASKISDVNKCLWEEKAYFHVISTCHIVHLWSSKKIVS